MAFDVHPTARIHPTAHVAEGARLAEGVEVGPFCLVGPQVILGARTQLQAHVIVEGETRLGSDNVLSPNVVLGGPGQIKGGDVTAGRLEIGDRNVFREGVTINRGSKSGVGVTRVGDDNYMMALSHIAHDCVVGNHVVFANAATLGGHVSVGDHVFLGGLCAVHQFNRIGRRAMIGGLTPLTTDVIPFGRVAGNPARLGGLNEVGLKRGGADPATVKALRRAYLYLFNGPGTFAERLDAPPADLFEAAEAKEILDFILADRGRELCHPPKRK